jgi:hypothetical protein
VWVQSHRHSVDFSMLSGGTKLFKLNNGHYEKLCLLAAVSCGGSIGGNRHQCAGADAIRVSDSTSWCTACCQGIIWCLVTASR